MYVPQPKQFGGQTFNGPVGKINGPMDLPEFKGQTFNGLITNPEVSLVENPENSAEPALEAKDLKEDSSAMTTGDKNMNQEKLDDK